LIVFVKSKVHRFVDPGEALLMYRRRLEPIRIACKILTQTARVLKLVHSATRISAIAERPRDAACCWVFWTG